MNAHDLLRYAHIALAVSVAVLVVSVLVAYPMESILPFPVLIAAHILTMIGAIGIKIAYIARLAALKNLNLPMA
ncbi:MAG: hypothetical protein ACWA5K_07930 [bacterium]